MGVTITRRPKLPRFDGRAIAAVIKGYVPGAILERTARGMSADGTPFAPYSARYREVLAQSGEDPRVDLRLSGGMLNSVKARGATITDTQVTITIAPDAGTSPVWAPKAREHGGKPQSRKTGRRSPPHNVVAFLLHYGTGKLPARPFLRLSPEQKQRLFALIRKVVFRVAAE